ncbi:hypothetical protein SAMN05444008_104231 [Cnuella takakiae]|uniref:Vitellogenin II n=1 Tax=Cnuella takakiae TaxID=1302690 RepID=A0A1M4YCW7_9BACT|nr:hypothetical protein [Cnuella takakiae]OLY93109.1 hypothetical protein BUE76_15320 [Cnuella takakiae]SHF03356.1 hypothetical protein SAMN05444008_104231 [Cnuella takakiae]
MKLVLPILATVLLATSCTTAYKSGQTPDDVYFSPERKVSGSEYVQRNREDQPTYRSNNRNRDYRDDYAYSDDDRYLRMKVRNRNRWSDLDNYYNDPYFGGYYARPGFYAGAGLWGGNFYSPYNYYNSFNNWNFYYNPYYNPYNRPWGHNVIVVNPSTPIYNRPRTYNLNTFNRGGNSYSSPKSSGTNYQSFDNRPTRSANSYGNDLRRSFDNNSSNNSYTPPSRSSNSSNSNSSSGGGSSSSGGSSRGSAPVRKF